MSLRTGWTRAVLAFAIAASSSAVWPFGETPARSGFILAAANAPGSHGTFWKTDVWIHNAGPDAAVVTFFLLPTGRSGDATPKGQLRIEPGETSEIREILGSFLHVTDLVGAVEFRVTEGPDVFVQSRTYASSSDGSPIAAATLADSATAADPLRATELRRSAAFRTNLSITNPLSKSVDFAVETWDDDGRIASLQRMSIDARSYVALNDCLASLGRARSATVVIRPDGDAQLLAVASVVSSENGEATIRSFRRP